MWNTLLKTTKWMIFFIYHRKWMGLMVRPLEDDLDQKSLGRVIQGRMAQWRRKLGTKMEMLGMILVTGEKLNSREWFHCLNGYGLIEETKGGSQLMPTINPSACACSQELEHFHIHQGSTNIRVEDPGNTSYYHDERWWRMQVQRRTTLSQISP